MGFRPRQLTKSIDIVRRKMSLVNKRFPTKCLEQGIQLFKKKLSRQMERVPCGKAHKYLVNREYRCFYHSNVVTKWRVLTARVAFVWRSKISLQDCPRILLHSFEEDTLVFLSVGKLQLKAVYQVVIFVSEICQFYVCQKSVK